MNLKLLFSDNFLKEMRSKHF